METAARRDRSWGCIARFDQVSTCTAEDELKWAIGHPHLLTLPTVLRSVHSKPQGDDSAVQPHLRRESRDAFVQINIRMTRNASCIAKLASHQCHLFSRCRIAQHSSVPYHHTNRAQHSTAQHSTAQHSIA
ncbi:hypothetical protein BDP81DRAFT_198521 [Colletotrichum phormii]|uniref:Uncharacterized protein n=1 Tax=Colletotrichum phormii TaxID=359342 RepID=A0AAI9ZYC6_9PEZI|nr:uncharacterized protein BDP81DRAFT_198521 [Colletotrichum phormii]KAK1639198.1 hypothetical protein BDP81DRAFT_198521 [Colletotrichum phormii]